MKLTPRQEHILKAVIVEHTRTAEPVGSKELVERFDLAVSPATIRSEMGALEELGLLRQPHTSAGRVPTELGYRYYVRSLMLGAHMLERQQQEVRRRMLRLKVHYEEFARETAQLLADMTEQVAITERAGLSERAGLRNVITLPELKDDEIAEAIAEVLDHPQDFVDQLEERAGQDVGTALAVPGGKPVMVYIGNETGLGRLPVAVMVATFGRGKEQGRMVLIGPARMQYQRNAALLSYVSRLLSTRALGAALVLVLPAALLAQFARSPLS